MKKITYLLLFLTSQLFSQTFTELPSMPQRVANNAVTGATVNGIPHVYSFSGIDSTKTYTGIHKQAFRYNTQTEVWDQIADLPTGNGRIAAGASTVKNKIYIIGGYEVFANGSEVSIDKTHIYDPETNSYETDGAPIPVAIDDQVQAVWRDSLIYVVTGWSDNTNVSNVQIYNPSNDEWLVGTPVPSGDYRVFGASGSIIGDTIYYLGGAKFGSNFPASSLFRKGVIDPNDPTNITWSLDLSSAGKAYRAAALTVENQGVYWIGGSEVTYNFDGIAYNGSGGVSPKENWFVYNGENLDSRAPDMFGNEMPRVMDLRGIATFPNAAFIAGGMLENQEATNKVFQINFDIGVSNQNLNFSKIKITPNPTSDFFTIEKNGNFIIELWDATGRLIFSKNATGNERVDISNINEGIYFVKIFAKGEWIGMEKLVKK